MIETKYTKTLYKAIRKLNLDREEKGQLCLCLYLNGCSSENCAKLFGITEEDVIKFLTSEELHGYQACSKCERLRDRENGFRVYKGRKLLFCKNCEKEYYDEYNKNNKDYKKEYNAEYRKNNNEEIREYNKEYNKNNKDYRKEYNKKYNKDNKEEIKIYNLQYNENNKEEIKESRKKYNQQEAPIHLVQQLTEVEEILDNQIRCKYCGKWMVPTINQVNNRVIGMDGIGDGNYIYCSEECKEECPTYGQKKYPKGFKTASSREVNPVLRQIVLERDDYTCQKCHKSQDELTVGLHCHHITPVVNSPIEANDPENCNTLCKNCHQEVHKIPGCGLGELKCG